MLTCSVLGCNLLLLRLGHWQLFTVYITREVVTPAALLERVDSLLLVTLWRVSEKARLRLWLELWDVEWPKAICTWSCDTSTKVENDDGDVALSRAPASRNGRARGHPEGCPGGNIGARENNPRRRHG